MITYYYITGNDHCSYNLVAKYHISSLRKLGYSIDEADISEVKPNEYALVHPLSLLRNHRRIKELKKNHKFLIGFQVCDSEAISKEWVELFNDNSIDLIITASNYSALSMKNSGVRTRIEVIPHGVSEKFRPMNISHKGIRAITFAIHSGFRKGIDILQQLVPMFPKVQFIIKGKFVVKGNVINFPRVKSVEKWMGVEELARFYNSSDIYLALQRSGGFEMNLLETLACGIPVISSAYGPVLDYLNEKNSLLAPVKRKTKLLPGNIYQTGEVAEPNIGALAGLLRYCIDNLDKEKKKAVKASYLIREKFNWDRIGKKIATVIESME